MLMVETFLAPSQIHGIGLFAGQDIKKGSVIWRYHRYSTDVICMGDLYRLCRELSTQSILDLLSYSYIKDEKMYYIKDNTRFVNHSLTPNIAFCGHDFEIAIKDIKKGDELTENYVESYDENDFFFRPSLFEGKSREAIIKEIGVYCANYKKLSQPLSC